MTNSKLTVIALLGFVTIVVYCNGVTNSHLNKNGATIDNDKQQVDKADSDPHTKNDSTTEVQTHIDSKALEFLENLKASDNLSSFFKDNWLFVYHEDDRCNGSTDGQLDHLKPSLIDSIITLRVKNDGDGWACALREPETYDLGFDLKKKVSEWDRFEILNYENQEENIVYVFGAGESDYIKLHYDDNNLIVKLEYRSEDPG